MTGFYTAKMDNKRLKYICYYDFPDSTEDRNIVYSSTTKLDYIFSALNRVGVGVDIVSFAGIRSGKKIRFCRGSHIKIGDNTLRKFSSFSGSRLISHVSRKLMALSFICWFLTHVKRGEKVAVYHSTGYDGMLVWLKKITGCRYIGEIEEMYQDVSKLPAKICRQELAFINCCDQYLFPTELLNEKVNKENKPVLIVYGQYCVEPKVRNKFDDGHIHVVYGGTFDMNKGGAVAAATAAAFLPSNYHVHICGFGNPNDTEHIKSVIAKVSRTSEAVVTFDGLKKGRDYVEFIQQCHIGLSTQNPSAAFNDTSFPSKILVYLSNGLEVVSIDIPVVRNSKISGVMEYYHEQTPEKIAEAIIRTTNKHEDMKYGDSSSVLKGLDERFCRSLTGFIC